MPADQISTTSDQNAHQPESSPFTPPQISLPKGGGAIRGIGEKFQANAATGTGKLTVPLSVSPGRSGFGPDLLLSYDSGSGNGVFGIGWSLPLPSVTRKTDKGLPLYRRRELQECDVFILSGSEDLVPALIQDATGHWVNDEQEIEGYRVKRYRPRIEGLFARIERWTNLKNGDEHWRSISKDNVLTVYGRDENSRIFDPEDRRHVFSWLICESYDDKGDAIVYEYAAENSQGVDIQRASELRRTRTANRYLKRIRYGNRQPLLQDQESCGFRASHLQCGKFDEAEWMFEVVFDYGEGHYCLQPRDAEGRERVLCSSELPSDHEWPVRKDPFSRYRSRFEIRTYRLCHRVLMFHRFPDELGAPECLARSTEFKYRQKSVGSFITQVTQSGYVRHADRCYLKKSMPTLELDYTSSPLESERYKDYEVREVDLHSLQNLPAGIDGENYKWLDLDGEGISGVLSEQGTGWFYKSNDGNGRLGSTTLVARKPSIAELRQGQQQLLDIAGKGILNLVQFDQAAPGYFERTLEDGWGAFRNFHRVPVLDWKNPNLRFVDVTGDGIADVLIGEGDSLLWHASLLDEGYGPERRVPVPSDERSGPRVIFADGVQSIYLADMSGDGLSDLVRVRNGEVCYWPNLGYGTFGSKVVMDNAPWLDDNSLFDQSRVKLVDTDGSGTTDIVYLGDDGIQIYLNESGNGWSEARLLPQFVASNSLTSISVVDFLGRGTACLVWSSTLPSDSRQSIRYVDLMQGQKPHLMIAVRNNLGAETRVEYGSSTEFYLDDKAHGNPWITRLPFPVHVVKRIEAYDFISRNRFVSSYKYHHGFFDGVEREFRGFGMVEQLDTEEISALATSAYFPSAENISSESNLPPVLTKTWFHTGVFLGNGAISRHLAHEYYCEPMPQEASSRARLLAHMQLEDTILPGHLTPDEAREACRALKGSMLRREVYALDGSRKSHQPYTVTESNSTIVLLQPLHPNLHAVLFTHPRELVTFNYERNLYGISGAEYADPRVTHSLTLEVDDFGNVLQSVSIAYGRRFPDSSPLLTAADHAKQRKLLATYTENSFTNAVSGVHSYRTPLPAETSTYELYCPKPSDSHPEITNLFRFKAVKAQIAIAGDGAHDLAFTDVNAAGAIEQLPCRRLLEQSRNYYRSDNLEKILPLGALEALALPGQTYKLAFTDHLIRSVYVREDSCEELLPEIDAVLEREAKYVKLADDARWWKPSGKVFYSPDECCPGVELEVARRHFFLPCRFVDPFHNSTIINYDRHNLFPVEVHDAIGNVVRSDIDYRVLSPFRSTDENRNCSEIAFDALGVVVGTAVRGKHNQHSGDSLDGFDPNVSEQIINDHMEHPLRDPQAILNLATTRLVYDLFAYARTAGHAQPQAAAVYTLARETHAADLRHGEHSKMQHSFSYSDGFGRVIQRKIQAEPAPPAEEGGEVCPRWVGDGWTIFNNKGNAVRRYEPFFTVSHVFEFAQMSGVSSVLFYDPLQRVVATLHANHTYEKVVFDSWSKTTWDVNDTVLENDPAQDPDVGAFFEKLPESNYLPTWYSRRINDQEHTAEREAALKTSLHARTPSLSFADSLGRTFLSVAHNREEHDDSAQIDRYFATRTDLDIQGNQRFITDALGRVSLQYEYDMMKTRLRQASIDAGTRWMLNDSLGKALLSWDSRSYRIRREYDRLHRPTNLYVRSGFGKEILAQRTTYGEGQLNDASRNLRGKLFRQFDDAGIITNERYDFKGNLLIHSRQLLEDYRNQADWSQSPELESAIYTSSTSYDALNRPVELTTPDASITRPHYNQANLLESLSVNVRGAEERTPFVTYINYNAKGQREIIRYGSGLHTSYAYDPLTFRMIHLRTIRRQDHANLQDLHYTYDPIGNVTSIRDDAQESVYFKNQVVLPRNSYTYDAIYRLIFADGREHSGGHRAPRSGEEDSHEENPPIPSDGHALRRYHEKYGYDEVGNILRLQHSSAHESWARLYTYGKPGLQPESNRLLSSNVGEVLDRYEYDADGNMIRMPHLVRLAWDFKNQLQATRRQVVHSGLGETTYYVYDSSGQRVRKVTERGSGSRKNERVYLGSFELYRKFDGVGAVTTERETLHVMDDKQRVALVETKTISDSVPMKDPASHKRLQFGNHLGSAVLELDGDAAIISYEEYYPYGSTSFEAANAACETSRKRYKYVGKERDEETGLYCYGARYYAPWIGRWTAADPSGSIDGLNLYAYVQGNPIRKNDPTGTQGEDAPKLELKTPSLLDNRTAAEKFADQHAGALGDFHLRLNDPSSAPKLAPWLHPDPNASASPVTPGSSDSTPDTGKTSSSKSSSSGDGPKVTGGAFLPHIQIDSKGLRFKLDVGFTSTKISLAGDTNSFRGRLGLEYSYGKDLKLSSMGNEGGGSIAVNPQTGAVTFGLQQNLTNRLTTAESINTNGTFTGSLAFRISPPPKTPPSPLDDPPTGAGTFITPVRSTPGGGGISPQPVSDPFESGINAAQGMLPSAVGVLQDPTRLPGFINANTNTSLTQPESNFTKVGRTVDAAKAVSDLQKNTFDLRVRLDFSADPKYGSRVMLNLQLVGF